MTRTSELRMPRVERCAERRHQRRGFLDRIAGGVGPRLRKTPKKRDLERSEAWLGGVRSDVRKGKGVRARPNEVASTEGAGSEIHGSTYSPNNEEKEEEK